MGAGAGRFLANPWGFLPSCKVRKRANPRGAANIRQIEDEERKDEEFPTLSGALALRFDPAHGVTDKGSSILQIELLFDMSSMHIHRFGAEAKLLCNFAGALALAHELKDFELAIA